MVIALQQRIGEMVMQYEGVIASLRADLTQMTRLYKIASGEAELEEKK